jgi:hypothetical protein
MPSPTDRGYAVISNNEDGTVHVRVCTAIEHGQPVGVYAQHVRAPFLRVDPGVHLVRADGYRYTTQVVEVSRGGGVLVRMRTRSLAI